MINPRFYLQFRVRFRNLAIASSRGVFLRGAAANRSGDRDESRLLSGDAIIICEMIDLDNDALLRYASIMTFPFIDISAILLNEEKPGEIFRRITEALL